MRRLICLFTASLLLAVLTVMPASAHANLSQSEPAANAVLPESPNEIRLWFTEPLESDFSRIHLQDASGTRLDTVDSQIDANDPMQMFMVVSDLPDGVYTVIWSVVSSADGHPLSGNFPFTVGDAVAGGAGAAMVQESIPQDSTLIRWFNLVSLSLTLGSIGFWLFVWKPSMPEQQTVVEPRLYRLMFGGWLLLGAANVLVLMLYVSSLTGLSLWEALLYPELPHVVMTRYGGFLMARIVLWGMLGTALYVGRKDAPFLWIAMACGGLMLVAQSATSHASATPDSMAAVFMNVLHLLATVFWVGGLVQFLNALIWAKQHFEAPTYVVSNFVKYFSNYARVAVILLIVTGSYTTWLQVGSVEALLTTQYGQTLLLKLILFAPLLVIAAVNLVFTARALQRGSAIWVGMLRGLIGAEIALTIGILVAAGALTSINTARAVQAQRQALIVEADDIVTMQINNELHAHLEITPGYVGQNTFHLGLYDVAETRAINDATLVRLRFQNMTQNLGTSELRPTFVSDGGYVVTGANLSAPGRWRIRMTLQRPGMFDTVLDFNVTVEPAPPAPTLDLTIPSGQRVIALILAGAACLAIGGFAAVQTRLRLLNGAGILAVCALLVGALCLVSSLRVLS